MTTTNPLVEDEILVKNIMTKNPVKVDKNLSVVQAAKMMAEYRVGTVMVVDKGNPIGIVTDTDMTKRIVIPAKDPKKLKVRDIMSSPLIFISPDSKVEDAVSKMKKHRVKRIPVVDKGKLVGIITTTDVAKATPEMLDLIEARLMMREGPPVLEETNISGLCEACENYSENLTHKDNQWVCNECGENL